MSDDDHPVEQPDVTDPEITPPYADAALLDGAEAGTEPGAEADSETDAEHDAKTEAGPGAGEGVENGEAARPPSHSVFADPEEPFALGGRRDAEAPGDAKPGSVVSIAGLKVKRKTLAAVLALWVAVFVGGLVIGDLTSRPASDVAQPDRQQTEGSDDGISSASAPIEGRRWRTATTAPPAPSTDQPTDDQAPDTGDTGEPRSRTTTTTNGSDGSDSEPSDPEDQTTTTTPTTSTTTTTTTTTTIIELDLNLDR